MAETQGTSGASGIKILAPPPRTGGLLTVGTLLVLITAAASFVASLLVSSRLGRMTSVAISIAVVVLIVCMLAWSLANAFIWAKRSRNSLTSGDLVSSRRAAAKSRHYSLHSIGYSAFFLVVAMILVFVCADDFAVQKTFLKWELIKFSALAITKAFGINILIAVCAQILAMFFGLVFAILRSLPGNAFRPLRVLAVCYIDGLRSLPAIVVIYLICLGVPLSGIPILSKGNPVLYAIIALSMTYAAYNAELFRSGIESIHRSQISAAYSLGLSSASVYRLVILPQASRRIAPEVLSTFVMLQKDTALVNIVGIIDAFSQSKIYSGNYYNLSSITVVIVLFILISIPQTRFVDYQLNKARKREMGA